ncbi:MAG: hypothetical protein MHPSP_003671, partial [Paramarteilia canceri]
NRNTDGLSLPKRNEQYWVSFSNDKDSVIYEPFINRSFAYSYNKKNKTVHNLWLKNWPDKDLPEVNSFFALIQHF